MYSQTYNMTPEEDNHFAGKTQNFEAVVQYQFDFGLRPSIGYVQTKGKDLQSRAGFSGGDADLVKYIEVGTWYYFNKNMNVYAAYKFNQLDDNDYAPKRLVSPLTTRGRPLGTSFTSSNLQYTPS